MVDDPVYVAGGTVQAGGGIYLERAADRELVRLCRSGAFAFILTSRQMGKSSLMVRTVERLSEEGIRSVIIDLTSLGADVTRDQWYKGLLLTLADQLGLTTNATRWWQEHEELGIPQRFNLFLRKVVLAEVTERVVIFIDEIDTTLRVDFTDDFFTAIRYLYNARADTPALERLSFVLIGVATPGDLIKDPERTPFNIGQRVDLTDFTLDQARPLLAGLSLPGEQEEQVLRWVLYWTGGHPYLTLRVFRAFDEQPPETWSQESVEKRISALFFGAMSEQDSNLQFVRDMLTKKAPDPVAVLETYRDIRRGREVRDEELSLVKSWLKLSGVVCATDGRLRVRNRIYESVFTPQWIREHLSVNWARVLSRVGLGVLLLLSIVVLPLALYAWRNSVLGAEASRREQEAKSRELAAVARANLSRRSAEQEKSLREVLQQRLIAERTAEEALAQRRLAEQSRQEAVRYQEKERNLKEVALARGLAAQASALRAQQPGSSFVLGNLLAVEALRRRPEEAPGALQLLREALPFLPSSLGRLVVQGQIIKLSPDGSRLLDNRGNEARVIDTATGRELGRIPYSEVYQLIFSADGRRLIGRSKGEFILWDSTTGREIKRGESVWSSSLGEQRLSSDGKSFVTAGNIGLLVWDLETGESLGHVPFDDTMRILGADAGYTQVIVLAKGGLQIRSRVGNSGSKPQPAWAPLFFKGTPVESAALSEDGSRLVTASPEGLVHVWEPPGGQVWKMPGQETGAVVRFGQNRDQVVVVDSYNTVHLWDLGAKREVMQFRHETSVESLQFSRNGSRLITVTTARIARVWDTDSGEELTRLGFQDYFGFDPNTLRSVTASKSVAEFWQVEGWSRILPLQNNFLEGVFSQDGRRFAGIGKNGFIGVWELEARKEIARVGLGDSIRVLAFGGTDWLLLGNHEAGKSSLGVLGLGSKKAPAWFPVDFVDLAPGWMVMAALSPSGRRIAIHGRENEIRILDALTGKPVGQVPYVYALRQLKFSPDGQRLATVDREGEMHIWALPHGRSVFHLPSQQEVSALAFSPNGEWVATGGPFGIVYLWEVETGRKLVEFDRKNMDFESYARVSAINFDRDGRSIVAATEGSGVHVFDVASGREAVQISHENKTLPSAAFSEDGRQIIEFGLGGKVVNMSPWRSEDLIAEVCQRLQRDLDPQEWEAYLGEEPYRMTCSTLPRSSPH